MKKLKNKIDITKLKEKLFDSDDIFALKPLTIILLVLGITTIFISIRPKIERPLQSKKQDSMDVFIPKGETLVPIKVANYESLDQIIGQYGVVDLYSTPLNPLSKPRRVAYAVKLLRSSNNRSHFSILVPTAKAARIVSYSGEFTVSVRNPKSIGTQFVKQSSKPSKRRIEYEMEGR